MTTNYLTVKEVAARWGVSPMTVYRLITEGSLAHTRVGRRIIRIEEAEADRFIADNTWNIIEQAVGVSR